MNGLDNFLIIKHKVLQKNMANNLTGGDLQGYKFQKDFRIKKACHIFTIFHN